MMRITGNLKEDIKIIARAKRTSSDALVHTWLAEMVNVEMRELRDRKWTTKGTDYLCPLCLERSVAIEFIDSEYHELYDYCKATPKYIAQCLSCEGESEPHDTPGLARSSILPYDAISEIKNNYFSGLHGR